MMITKSLRVVFFALLAILFALTVFPLITPVWRLVLNWPVFSVIVDAVNLTSAVQTITMSALSLLLGLFIALPLSWLLVCTDLSQKNTFRNILFFPFVLPPYLYAIAWATLAVPGVGLLNRWLGNIFNVYSLWGLAWVLACSYLPVLLSSICHALESMDPSLEEAARVFGASRAKAFFKIVLPCIFPAIASSSLLFLLAAISAFDIPALIGIPARYYVLTTRIYTYAKMGGLFGIDQAFALSTTLLLSAGLFLFLNEVIRKRFQQRLLSGKVPRRSVVHLRRLRIPLLCLAVFACFILVVLPLGAIITSSFLRLAGKISLDNFTFENYRYLFSMPETSRALTNSLMCAAISAFFCTVIGFGVSYFKDRTSLRFRNLCLRLATFPYAVPGTVLALALIVSYGSGWGVEQIALLGSPLLLLIAYCSKYLALSVQALTPALSSVDPVLEESARVCGAGPWKTIRRILVPILRPVLVSVFILTAMPVLSELTMSVLLAGPGTETIGMLLFQLQDYANPLAACSLAVLLLIFLLCTVPLINRMLQGERM
ncbi:MAG: iron ABC transporter permease [Deltaproteobacteria bacterium]|nr:iron ABC transporter permease [Deltaproteobacteria bacterium]